MLDPDAACGVTLPACASRHGASTGTMAGESSEAVKVFVRIRPLIKREIGTNVVVHPKGDTVRACVLRRCALCLHCRCCAAAAKLLGTRLGRLGMLCVVLCVDAWLAPPTWKPAPPQCL